MILPPIVLVAAISIAAPTPEPSLPPLWMKTITHVRANALCTELHQVIMPFVATEKKNNERFAAMDKQLAKYHEWYRPAADGDVQPNGTPEYNGAQALAAGQIDQMAANMYVDITNAEKKIDESEQVHPAGHEPRLDALREKAREILRLQRQLADRYEQEAGSYLNSIGSYLPSKDPALDSEFTLPALQPEPLSAARPPSVVDAHGTPPPQSAYGAQDPKDAPSSAQVVKDMMTQEYAFVKPALETVRTCDGS
jgi:hypothetical protein